MRVCGYINSSKKSMYIIQGVSCIYVSFINVSFKVSYDESFKLSSLYTFKLSNASKSESNSETKPILICLFGTSLVVFWGSGSGLMSARLL